jgi:hypothetical protein
MKAIKAKITCKGLLFEVMPSPKPTENGKRNVIHAIGLISRKYFDTILFHFIGNIQTI